MSVVRFPPIGAKLKEDTCAAGALPRTTQAPDAAAK